MENIMKKFSTLALATTFAIASTAAQAVTIYDKDGTTKQWENKSVLFKK